MVSCALLASAPGRAQESAGLVAELEVRVLKMAESELGRIERQLRSHPSLKAASAANITLQLQTAIEEDLGRGPVKLFPRAIFDVCLKRLQKGEPSAEIGKSLVVLYRRGELAHATMGDAGDKAPIKADAPAVPKKVASFVFDRERVRSPDPHLPPNFTSAPGEKVKGLYQICVDTHGKVMKVTTVQSIPGADQAVMEQIQNGWFYKPQPVPVCTTRAFVFQFN